MRFLIFIAVCISSALAADFSRYMLSSVRAKAPNVRLNLGPNPEARTKRDIRLHPLEDPDLCISNCTYDMHNGLEAINESDTEVDKMTKLCMALEPAEACFKACPESKFRKLMLDFVPLLKQPCLLGTDKVADLVKAMDCLNSTSDAVVEKCDSLCNSSFAGDIRMDSRVVLNVNPAFVLYDDDKLENRDVLKSTCKYITCTQQCGDPITKAQCGQLGVEVDHKQSSSIFSSVIKLYNDMEALDGDVKECSAIL